MKPQMLIFFSFFLILYGLIHYSFYLRGWEALTLPHKLKIPYTIIFSILALSFPVAMILRDKLSPALHYYLQTLGSFWMIIILYAGIFILILWLIRLVNHYFPFYPDIVIQHYIATKRILFGILTVVIATIFIIGNRNFRNPETVGIDIQTDKNLGSKKEINILFFSDFHLNGMYSEARLREYVSMMKSEKIDIVLIGGDLLDGDNRLWEKHHYADVLRELKPEYGIYACMGNHEFYTGIEKSRVFYQNSGIRLLRDGVVKPDDNLNILIAGRDDRTNSSRSKINTLLDSVDKENNFIIALDHQPAELTEAAESGVDLLLCGHTHNGQIFPINYVIRAIWKVAYGHKKIDKMDLFVSSGLGIWGPPIRIGSKSEIVRIRIRQ